MSYSCIFPNKSGDIVITWDEHNKEQVLSVIKKKMEEGYTFFTTKKYSFGTIERKGKVTKRDLSKLKSLIIDDAEFEKYLSGIDDPDIAGLINKSDVSLGKVEGSKNIQTLSRAKDPRDIVNSRSSVGIRPIHGG
jgi:hypothetical protein